MSNAQQANGPTFAPILLGQQRTLALLTGLCLIGLVSCHAYHAWCGAPLVRWERAPRPSVRLWVDVNRADWPELTLLPNIGEALARRIVESREQDGPFRTSADLARVRGIGPKKLAEIRPFLEPLAPD